MNDPKRLLDEGSRWGRAVLGAAADEAPPPQLRRAIHNAVFAGSVGATVGTASTAAATSVGTKASSMAVSVAAAKWVGVVAVGAAASLGAHALTHRQAARVELVTTQAPLSPVPTHVPRAATATRPAPPAPPLPDLTRVSPAPPSAPVNTATPQPLAHGSPPASTALPADDSQDFAREVTSLDAARAALAANDFLATMDQLNRYELDHPHGRLRPEALAVRIQAYAAKPDALRAKELARQFVALYPSHPFAAEARATVERGDRATSIP